MDIQLSRPKLSQVRQLVPYLGSLPGSLNQIWRFYHTKIGCSQRLASFFSISLIDAAGRNPRISLTLCTNLEARVGKTERSQRTRVRLVPGYEVISVHARVRANP